MIVVCKGCDTRYRLNDKLAPGKAGKARCKRCGDTFWVVNPAPKQEIFLFDQNAALNSFGMDNVIVFSNQKGGVAKTSTCLNLGLSLALLKKRVLMIDFDGQANLTLSLGYQNKTSFFEIVDAKARDLAPHIIKTQYPGLWLLPSNSNMALLNKKYFGVKHFEFLLKDRLNLIADQFDFILIDTPPSIEFFTLNALTVARMVVIPCPCEFLAAHGVDRIEKMVAMVQAKTNPRIEFRVLITMFDKGETASKVIYDKLQEMYLEKLFQTIIELDGKLKESQIVSMPAIVYDRNSISGRQYFNLAKEILSLGPFQPVTMAAMKRSYEHEIQLDL